MNFYPAAPPVCAEVTRPASIVAAPHSCSATQGERPGWNWGERNTGGAMGEAAL